MEWLIHILVNAIVLLIAAKLMASVEVRNFTTALITAFLIGIIGFLIGWLLEFILNVATLGLFYFTGLSFIIRIIANAIVIEIVDQVNKGFNTRGFWPSLWLAIIIALAGAIVDAALLD